MLTGKMLRVRYARDRIIPYYLPADDSTWLETAEQLLTLYRGALGRTRGELEDEIADSFDNAPQPQIYQGLAKLLEDRCQLETVSEQPPAELRSAVFAAAAQQRREATPPLAVFDRQAVLAAVGGTLGITAEEVEHGLFADLKSEQKLLAFEDITAERLLERYNVALAQAVLYRATAVQVEIRRETPQRLRQLLRTAKFHRLVCEIDAIEHGYRLRLDGPLSLFTATLKYGLQLAMFLPAVLLCKDFELTAELQWTAQRKPRRFVLTPKDGLVSHYQDRGTYVPPELSMFVELFRKKSTDWDIAEETDIVPLGKSLWVPDYKLIHRPSRQVVYLDVLGFWRRTQVESLLHRLRGAATVPYVLALSEQLRVEEAELAELPANVVRFRNLPLPEEVIRVAAAQLR